MSVAGTDPDADEHQNCGADKFRHQPVRFSELSSSIVPGLLLHVRSNVHSTNVECDSGNDTLMVHCDAETCLKVSDKRRTEDRRKRWAQ